MKTKYSKSYKDTITIDSAILAHNYLLLLLLLLASAFQYEIQVHKSILEPGPEVVKLFHAQLSWAWNFPANKY